MRLTFGQSSMLLAPAEEAPQSGNGTAAAPAKALFPTDLKGKIAAMAADTKKNKPKARLVLDLSDGPDLTFTISKDAFLGLVGPSSSGESNGVTMVIEDTFEFDLDGTPVKFSLSMRGGWTTVKVVG